MSEPSIPKKNAMNSTTVMCVFMNRMSDQEGKVFWKAMSIVQLLKLYNILWISNVKGPFEIQK